MRASLPLTLLFLVLFASLPEANAQTADEPLDESLKWGLVLHGEADRVTIPPELTLDETDKRDGASSLAFHTAGGGGPDIWISLGTYFSTPINVANYEKLAVSYKITPKSDVPFVQKNTLRICLENPGHNSEVLMFDQPVEFDGEWHTFEVLVADFKQPQDPAAEQAIFDGDSVASLGFWIAWVNVPEFDLDVKFDNIRLTPKK